ncbi:uncharacterized protein BDZ99DRAFT_497482 [Mytilinidion resinicola]|uniref:Apple domain-containing protein n=1 Tax=Mytilinidion resinicola TaxID=574789 RepID=A0A6A6YV48_9PEZI|nr:uncharacterized protein BDZ99DRAFT_497482 [Mytilinidion resinicola]KAF2811845.1 hypothetical protein BDZ99DRAFT_497482 [Mytilinidion resinicola]
MADAPEVFSGDSGLQNYKPSKPSIDAPQQQQQQLASQSSASPTSSSAPAIYTPPAPSTIPLIAASCPPPPTPASNTSLLHDTDGACAFRCTNATSLSRHGANENGSQPRAERASGTPNATAIAALVAYSLQDCMDACTSMNHLARQTLCVGFTIRADLGYAVTHSQPAANCWLVANATGSGGCEMCASGRLCRDEGCEGVF